MRVDSSGSTVTHILHEAQMMMMIMIMIIVIIVVIVVSSTTANNEPLHDCLSLATIPIFLISSITPSIHPPKVWSPHTPASFEFRIRDSSDHFVIALSL